MCKLPAYLKGLTQHLLDDGGGGGTEDRATEKQTNLTTDEGNAI
jgi:hypothetical protein